MSNEPNAAREELPEYTPVLLLLERPLLTPCDLLCLVYTGVPYAGLFACIINTVQLVQSQLQGV